MAMGQVRTDKVEHFQSELPVKRAVINAASSGDNTLVAAVTGKKIRVLSIFLVCTAAVAVTMKSASTALTGAMTFTDSSGLGLGFNQFGWLETAAGEALVATLGGAVQVSGALTYIEID